MCLLHNRVDHCSGENPMVFVLRFVRLYVRGAHWYFSLSAVDLDLRLLLPPVFFHVEVVYS